MRLQNVLFIISIFLFFVGCTDKEKQEKVNASISNMKTVGSLKVTTLSTMVANQGLGEWGYSALVEVDGKQILFDTGRKTETVLNNAEELGIDLSNVQDVILSHNHGDHTGGLITLRNYYKRINPKALSRIHVGKGIFKQRLNMRNRMKEIREELEKDGVEFIVYNDNYELYPGVWITGPIERIHPEKNYGGKWKIATEDGSVIDNIPEDQSLVIYTDKGFVVIAGCGHAGLINTGEHIKRKIHDAEIYALIGGFHLVQSTDEQLDWTVDHLKRFGVRKIVGAHCTGINSLYYLRNALGLSRKDAVVGSVGDNFSLEHGIEAGIIAM